MADNKTERIWSNWGKLLTEITRRDMYTRAPPGPRFGWDKSGKKIWTPNANRDRSYRGIGNELENPLESELKVIQPDGTLIFETISGTITGKVYTQKIILKDLDFEEMSPKSVRDALQGTIKVQCECPAFLYWGWAYIMSKEDGLDSENYKLGAGQDYNIAPSKNNPDQKGTICKHLDNCLRVLPFWSGDIYRDLYKERF